MKILTILAVVIVIAGTVYLAAPVFQQIQEVRQSKTSVDQLVQYIQENEPKGWLMSFFGNEVGVEYFGQSFYKNQTWGGGLWSFEGTAANVLQELQKRIWDQ